MEFATTKTYNAVSLFSGLGGDSLGMCQAGCNLIAYNEIQPVYCQSHNYNFPDSELIKDGTCSDISKMSDECFEKYNNNIDILFAGFPCQGFSNAGKKMTDDPRNTMFLHFLRVTRITQPKMIIGENVKGLLTRKTTDGLLYIDIIKKEFEELGYDIIYKVFKCEQYNVPQKRERLIILGIKKENPYGWLLSFPKVQSKEPNLLSIITYNMTGAVKVPEEWFAKIPSNCVLNDMEDTNEYNENNSGHPYLLSKLNADVEDRFYDGKQHDYLFSFGKRSSPIHCEIIDIRSPCKTIICTYNHQPRLFVPLRNVSGCYLRMLLIDELKQIQGFPADYVVCGSYKDKIIQIGNAVPPPLVKSIVEHIIS